MKKIVLLAVTLILVLSAGAQAMPGDVLAHASGEWIWFAHVSKAAPALPTDAPAATEQTECFALASAPGQQWKSLPTLPGRAVALAARSSQLAVLMSDGSWLTLWEDGSATGQPLPAGGRIQTFTDDGSHLWAIGSVNGGIIAAQRAIIADTPATEPTTNPQDNLVAAAPSTMPDGLHVVRSMPAKMVLFQEQGGRWTAVTELPSDALMTTNPELSLAVVGGLPLVSFKTDADKIRTIEFTAEHAWKDVGWIGSSDHQPVKNFSLFSDGFKPLLWLTTGNDAGELVGVDSAQALPIKLNWVGKDSLDGVPAVTFAAGYVGVFGPCSGKVLEQRYKADGTPVETAAELVVPHDSAESLLPRWFEVAFLTSMGFSVGASVFRQWAEPQKGPAIKPPVPATTLPRLAAGLLDALPVIGAVFYLGIKSDGLDDISAVPTEQWIVILCSAIGLYLLHTTLLEVFTARSAGKWLFGLKVVTLDGNPPGKSQLLIRNLLRVIDPLLMIIISPQAQRSADAVAGTMVVPLVPLPERSEDDADQN